MAPGLNLFFMISGALLLSRTYKMKPFLLRRFSKIAWPTLFWSLFYLLEKWIQGFIDFKYMVLSILAIPFGPQGDGVLWFMYALMGLYIITPILSSWLSTASKKEVEWILFLWSISLIIPPLGCFLHVNKIDSDCLFFYFSGYIGYYILGYYLHHYVKTNNLGVISCFIIIPLALAAIVKLSGMNVDFYQYFWYLSIPVAMMATFWFLIGKRTILYQVSKPISNISNYSFGIYLVHIFVMHRIVWKWSFVSQYGSVLQIIITTILTFSISYLIVFIISKFPFSKYIIGVNPQS